MGVFRNHPDASRGDKDGRLTVYPDLLTVTARQPAFSQDPWQQARNRVLGYLDAIGVAPGESLETGRQALERTRRTIETEGGGHPVSTAMETLRCMLAEQGRIEFTDPARLAPGTRFLPVPASPEFNIGNMIPQKLEIFPWNRSAQTRNLVSFRWIAPYVGLLILLIYLYLLL